MARCILSGRTNPPLLPSASHPCADGNPFHDTARDGSDSLASAASDRPFFHEVNNGC